MKKKMQMKKRAIDASGGGDFLFLQKQNKYRR